MNWDENKVHWQWGAGADWHQLLRANDCYLSYQLCVQGASFRYLEMSHHVSVYIVEIDKRYNSELPPATIELVIRHLPAHVIYQSMWLQRPYSFLCAMILYH